MAKKPTSSDEGAISQSSADSTDETPSQAKAAAKLIQFDPRAPRSVRRVIVPQSLPTIDTIIPHSDWHEAKKELLKRLPDPFQMRISPQSYSPTQPRSRILGIGIGFKYSQGSLTGELCVKTFVEQKLAESVLDPSLIIPAKIGGFPTDVEAISPPVLHAADAHYDRPVPCGVSVGLVGVFEIGTIGCLVARQTDGQDEDLCILSNNHVLANSNGDANPTASQIGQQVLQPGQVTQGPQPDDVIGELEAFVALRTSSPNYVDGAIALTSFDMVSPNHVTYTLNPTPVQPAVGMTVMKNGMMTGSSIGVITDIAIDQLPVPYTGLGTILFYNQIAVRGISGAQFSSNGDSGSLIVTLATKQPVALLFSGGQDQQGFVTYANPIDRVMQELGITRFINSTS